MADAQAKALVMVGKAANTPSGQKAIQLELATKAIHAKEMIAKHSSLVLLPDGATDAATVVTQAMAIIQKISTTNVSSVAMQSSDIQAEPSGGSDTSSPWDK